MKGLKIVSLLTFIMVLASVAIFFVEGVTSAAIKDREDAEIAEALEVFFPEYNPNAGYTAEAHTTEDTDFGISGIEQVFDVKDPNENIMGYFYQVAFQGYASNIKYIFATDSVGQIIGYRITQQADTPGFGAQIADEENWTQFIGMLLSDAGDGNFDGLSGASITTGKWKASMEVDADYHKETYGEPSAEDILALKKAQLVPEGASLAAVTVTDKMTDAGISSVDIASVDGKEVAVVYIVEFAGYSDGYNQYMVSYDIETQVVLKYVHLESGDSEGYGLEVMQTAYWAHFVGKTADELYYGQIDAIAGTSGAPITTQALADSLTKVSVDFFNNYTDTPRYLYEELLEIYKLELFPTATNFVDITANKTVDFNVKGIYDAFNGDTYLGTVYNTNSVGMSDDGFVFMELLVGIDTSKAFTGVRLLESNKVVSEADKGLFEAAAFESSVDGLDIQGVYELGTVVAYENVSDSLSDALDKAVFYHLNKYYSFISVADEDLLLAFPTATTFESVYADYDVVNEIGNIYVAKDATDTVLGYVYYASTTGFGGKIEFIYGVDAAGVSTELIILENNESWADSGYNGSEGNSFKTSTWLDKWETEAFTDLVTGGASEVDVVGGVSTTTGAMVPALLEIINYHIDNSVGGAS